MAQFDPGKGNTKVWLMQYAYHRAINRRQHLQGREFYKNTELQEEDLDDRPVEAHATFGLSSPETKDAGSPEYDRSVRRRRSRSSKWPAMKAFRCGKLRTVPEIHSLTCAIIIIVGLKNCALSYLATPRVNQMHREESVPEHPEEKICRNMSSMKRFVRLPPAASWRAPSLLISRLT